MDEKVFVINGSEIPVDREWLVGETVSRAIYVPYTRHPDESNRHLIGMMDSPELAEYVVEAVNAYDDLLEKAIKFQQDADVFQDEIDRLSKALKDAAEASSSNFVDSLAAANRPSAPDRAALVEWLHEYHMYEYHQCERVADSMLASDLFAREPATGTVSVPWDAPDDQPVTKGYVDAQYRENARERDLALETMREQRDRAEAERDKLREHLKDANQQLGWLQTNYDNLNTAFTALKKDRDWYKKAEWAKELEAERDKLLKDLHDAAGADTSYINEVKTERNNFEAQVSIQSIAIDSMRLEIARLTDERDKFRRDRNRSHQQIRDLDLRSVELRKQRDKSLLDVHEAVAQVRKVEDLNRQLVTENVDLKKERDKALQEVYGEEFWGRMIAELDEALNGSISTRDATPEEVWRAMLNDIVRLVEDSHAKDLQIEKLAKPLDTEHNGLDSIAERDYYKIGMRRQLRANVELQEKLGRSRDDEVALHAEIRELKKELLAKDQRIAEDIEEVVRLRGDAKMSHEDCADMLANHNYLADLVIKEFGVSVAKESPTEAIIRLLREQKKLIENLTEEADVLKRSRDRARKAPVEIAEVLLSEFDAVDPEQSTTEAAIRLLRVQKKQINELEDELARHDPERKGAADSAVDVAADIASVLVAGIRKWNEQGRP